jgi:hypothetical protein
VLDVHNSLLEDILCDCRCREFPCQAHTVVVMPCCSTAQAKSTRTIWLQTLLRPKPAGLQQKHVTVLCHFAVVCNSDDWITMQCSATTTERQHLARHLHVTVSQGLGGLEARLASAAHAHAALITSCLLTDTAASASAILLQCSAAHCVTTFTSILRRLQHAHADHHNTSPHYARRFPNTVYASCRSIILQPLCICTYLTVVYKRQPKTARDNPSLHLAEGLHKCLGRCSLHTLVYLWQQCR